MPSLKPMVCRGGFNVCLISLMSAHDVYQNRLTPRDSAAMVMLCNKLSSDWNV